MSELDPGAAIDDASDDAPDAAEALTAVEVITVVEETTIEDVSDAPDVSDAHDVSDASDDVARSDDVERSDARTDARLESLDDGSAAVSGTPSGHSAPEALPFTMSAREHFAAVDALESTGDARVDAATARLEEVPDLPTADHVEVYEDVHRRLQDALSEAEVR